MTIRSGGWSKNTQYMICAHWLWTIHPESIRPRSRNWAASFPGAIWISQQGLRVNHLAIVS
jgi:hypothetical protein